MLNVILILIVIPMPEPLRVEFFGSDLWLAFLHIAITLKINIVTKVYFSAWLFAPFTYI